jgi:ADP-ribosylglycohydrolase
MRYCQETHCYAQKLDVQVKEEPRTMELCEHIKFASLKFLFLMNNKKLINENMVNIQHVNVIKSALFGVAVGDALGVPVEFSSREKLKNNPVTTMIGGEDSAWHQPAGTWSDDSSLTFCLADALTMGFDLHKIASYFVQWYSAAYWTPHGEVFDIGFTTQKAIENLAEGVQPDLAGGVDEWSNGNGSLMRILPLVFFLVDKSPDERFKTTKQVSSMTHGHTISVIACFYYLEFAREIVLTNSVDKHLIYKELQRKLPEYLAEHSISPEEGALFDRLLKNDISQLPEEEIRSSGYVLDTLEASIWCVLTTNSYEEAVLKAVNLGGDTDTTAAVTGGLAGLLYGFDHIPENWLRRIARYGDIMDLCERLGKKLDNK